MQANAVNAMSKKEVPECPDESEPQPQPLESRGDLK